ncbi:MAG: hypothetical protein A3J93_02930 [Candidatus Magasanikbacteria bacterium RIFOXYC2_FULL_42_28]|uniref:PEP-utilising enzyme mobile domain-containing protein n=1 Tax=Candidatus Magasanikbacteria bacterium RIFOXYC2_FULL_42_28 TaxID=1798704 RepID=A0A1F6NU29_9BACT|nr:MAG: hypothetical protein A3J93_02930 [Candidatus Magasanikbacteria bacterium RIFOXYC2_FULL_42_28]
MIYSNQKLQKNAWPPFTEWLKKIQVPNGRRMLIEDNSKRHRLDLLHILINLPYDKPEKMTLRDINERTPLFKDTVNNMGNQQCMLRAIPKNQRLPKLRLSGRNTHNAINWLKNKKLDEDKYWVEIRPRSKIIKLSAIFIINNNGIWGEINEGRLSGLSIGNCQKMPIFFSSNFTNWIFSKHNKYAIKIIKKAVQALKVTHAKTRSQLKEQLGSSFNSRKYLRGYFEFMVWPGDKIRFIDYNRIQGRTLAKFDIWQATKATILTRKKPAKIIKGISANSGKYIGKARIVNGTKVPSFQKGEILVCTMPTLEYIPYIKKAGAIIMERGTILCHAAIICRELNKPSLIRVKGATKKIKTGQMIEVDANKGFVKILQQH